MYNLQKPTNWGLNLCVIADSTNGYNYGLIPYYGSTTAESLMNPELTFTSGNVSRTHKQGSQRNT
jgi:hypothetical protein